MRPLTPQEIADMALREDQARRAFGFTDDEAAIVAARTPRSVLRTLTVRDWLTAAAGVALFVATCIIIGVSQ